MSPLLTRLGLVIALSLTAPATALGQNKDVSDQEAAKEERPVKPTGPAAKKADELIKAYTARIEKEINDGRKEVQRLRAELHELIDVRYAMTEAIAELRGELATKGTYSGEPLAGAQPAPKAAPTSPTAMPVHRDFVYGLGSAMAAEPTVQEREQLRRLAPRADLKRMIDRLRTEVDETRAEVDELAYKLLELRSGVSPASFPMMGGGMMGGMSGGMGGMMHGMGGMMGGMSGGQGQWFGTMGGHAGGMR